MSNKCARKIAVLTSDMEPLKKRFKTLIAAIEESAMPNEVVDASSDEEDASAQETAACGQENAACGQENAACENREARAHVVQVLMTQCNTYEQKESVNAQACAEVKSIFNEMLSEYELAKLNEHEWQNACLRLEDNCKKLQEQLDQSAIKRGQLCEKLLDAKDEIDALKQQNMDLKKEKHEVFVQLCDVQAIRADLQSNLDLAHERYQEVVEGKYNEILQARAASSEA